MRLVKETYVQNKNRKKIGINLKNLSREQEKKMPIKVIDSKKHNIKNKNYFLSCFQDNFLPKSHGK